MKKTTIALALFLIAIPAPVKSCVWFENLFPWITYQEPEYEVARTPWKTEVKKAAIVPSSPWKEFKEKSKPIVQVSHKPKDNSWNWTFWGTKNRGTEDEVRNFVTDERTTTEPPDA